MAAALATIYAGRRAVTLLVISPDYASHLYPLATLATAWQQAGERVVVATGSATDEIVRGFGFEREHLQLGRGSNPGVIRAEDQPRGEDEALRGFFDATRRGAVETLAFQAAARGDDLLWDPLRVAKEVAAVVDRVRPDHVLVDHLAFSARLALTGAGVRHADVVLGHPSALTVGDEVYGYPPDWPRGFAPDPSALDRLHGQCVQVRDAFTKRWNDTLQHPRPVGRRQRRRVRRDRRRAAAQLPGGAPPARADPAAAARTRSSVPRCAREAPDPEVDAWLASGGAPVVYVSLGSFLSVRSDVLARIAAALRGLDVRVALASGSTAVADLGPIPGSWLVRRVLPQVTLLNRSVVMVSHGGNNSVTEALTAGVPSLAAAAVDRPVRRRGRARGGGLRARSSTPTPCRPRRSATPCSGSWASAASRHGGVWTSSAAGSPRTPGPGAGAGGAAGRLPTVSRSSP